MDTSPHWVETTEVSAVTSPTLSLTGVVRARYETPQAFQISGQIATRHVDAGQKVHAGDVLFTLDPRDLDEALSAARAELAAAEASLAVTQADLARDRQLLEKNFLSRQAFERAELALSEATTRRDAAKARMEQARNALNYATLRAGSDGLLIEVSAEPGQVVATGQAVAVLARDGRREVEVAFPSHVRPPQSGELLMDGQSVELTRREVAGAADPASRTWQARYQLDKPLMSHGLGEVVKTRFIVGDAQPGRFQVAVSAVDERGEAPRLWQVVQGRAQPLTVSIERMGREYAWVSGEGLHDGQTVIALGTHLLTPDLAVRPRGQEVRP
ncbi:MAG: efflux RND transporter periplasmic adaptor subunit [Gammaproteobacteria bacterium]|nr:efflux RND transporter periplasmic adaptor subunit [Gammaproteobacteria bacterium]